MLSEINLLEHRQKYFNKKTKGNNSVNKGGKSLYHVL